MKRIALVLSLILIAGQASALSCVRPDVVRTFQWAAASEDSYIVLMGQFSFATPPPRGGTLNAPDDISLPARFNGQYLGADGFQDGPAFDLTLNLTCAASWCASMTSDDGQAIAFARQTSQGYVVDVGPCGGNVFTQISTTDVQRVEACMRGEDCQEIERLR